MTNPVRTIPAVKVPDAVEWNMDPVLTFPERNPEIWVVGSAVLGVAMSEVGVVAKAHAAVVILTALVAALGSRRMPRLLIVLVYGGICDVLWRMTESRAPWEASKYIIVLVALSALLRLVPQRTSLGLPITLLAFLLPGAAWTLLNTPLGDARNNLSFILMGMVALASATVLCKQLTVSRDELRGLLWWGLSPCMTVWGITAWGTLKAGNIEFGNESMFETAGGFGPNQVSTILGLGALLVLASVMLGTSGRARIIGLVVAGLLVAQAMITLSRGGVYALALAAAAMLLISMFLSGNRSRGFVVLAIGLVIGLVALNWAQSFSGGAVENRTKEGDSGRGRIASAEVALFWSHPLTGVGVGQAPHHRGKSLGHLDSAASHNEYSRLVAEHGLLGLGAIVTLGAMGLAAFRRSHDARARSVALGLCAWSAAVMSHSATRLGAVAAIFAIASLKVADDQSDVHLVQSNSR